MWMRRSSGLYVPFQAENEDTSPKRRVPWRYLVAVMVVLAGVFALIRGISMLGESAIARLKSAADNYVKLDVPQPPVGNALYFGTCTMTAVYAYWDYRPFADLIVHPDEYWAQDISIELTIAEPSSVPGYLTLILAGTATTPNGLGTNPSITWSTLDNRQVDGPSLSDTVTWGEPYPGDHFTFRVPPTDRRFAVVLDSGYLTVEHDATAIRVLFRSDTKNPVGQVDGVRTTVDLPLVWEVSWALGGERHPTLTRSQINTFWGNPACATTTVTTRFKGPLTNASRYRLDSGSGTTTGQGIEFVRRVDHKIDYFYGQTIYSMTSPQLSFIDRNGEVAAQRTATIATSLWIAIGLGAIPLGLQALPSRLPHTPGHTRFGRTRTRR